MKKLLIIIMAFMSFLQINAQRMADYVGQIITSGDSPVTLYGCKVGEKGMFTFPSDTGSPLTKIAGDVQVYGGATIVGSEYYAVYYLEEGSIIHMPLTLTVYDADTWEVKRVYKDSKITGIPTDLAYDHQTKNIYGCFMNFDYSQTQTFGRLVFDEKEMTYDSEEIAQFPERMMAMTVDTDGQLYSIGASGQFYKVNKYNGEVTLVGNTEASSMQWGWQTMCFDKASGNIFWAGNNDMFDQCLYKVDPATGKAVEIANNGYDQITGMFIKQQFAEVKLPSVVTSFAIEFNDDSLTGNITFVMPVTYTDGTPIEGALSYKVAMNGKEILSKESKAGAKVSEQITVPADDLYTIEVSAVADGVSSETEKITKFIGKDSPMPVENLAATLKTTAEGADYEIELSWDAPYMSQHGGYINMDALYYQIIRYPGQVLIADNLKNTAFTDKLPNSSNGRFFYDVISVCEGKESAAVRSNNVKIGGVTEYPYTETFDTAEAFENYTVIDANGDGSTWTYENNMAAYTYNQKNAADDYLVTPPMALRADRYYIFKFKASNTYPVEKVAAFVGTDETAEALNICIVEPAEIEYQKPAELKGTFQPEKDGRYYFAIKAMSDADRSSLYVDNIEIIEKTADGPEAVTDLSVKAGEKGALNATVTFTAPTMNMDGTQLTSIKSVRISCNDVNLAELTDVKPGEQYVYFDDQSVIEGVRTYSVEVRNENSYGKKAEASAYVGIDIPGKVLNLKATEDLEAEGTVILTWDAPSEGQHGGYVDPEGLTYIISKGAAANDINNGSSREYRDKLDISKGKQVFEGYNVYADNSRGSGRNVWQTIVTVAGPAVVAPMNESLSGMHMLSGPWVTTVTKGEVSESSWIPVDGVYQKSGSQDNDGGLWVFKSAGPDKECRIESPKVDIRSLSSPMLSFWLYGNSDGAKVDVTIQPEFGDFEYIGTVNPVKGSWTRYTFDLSKYAGTKFIRACFAGSTTVATTEAMSLDNISVAENAAYNLQLVSATFPQRTVVGQKAEFKFAIRNAGSNDISGSSFAISLYKNGTIASTVEGFDFETGGYAEFPITYVPTVSDKEKNTYYISIDYADDEFIGDNKSEEVSIDLEYPSYPTVTDVQAQLNGGAVAIGWKAPDLSNMEGVQSTESFEMYEKFIIDDIGEWTVVDADKKKTILISLGEAPLDYPNAGKEMAWQVFNSLQAGIPFDSWTAKTGDQMIVAMKAVGGENDDWLISPELSGKAQTISFYAKTGMNAPYIPERLQVLYSATDKGTASFTQVDEIELDNVKQWNYYKFEVPEGARYFALRCVSNNKFALLVDDISYISKDAREQDLALLGYNVYRDDVRLNAEPLLNIHYDDASIEAGKDYIYNVTAVYEQGESRYSESCSVNTSGIDDIMAPANSVSSVKGGIMINAGGPVTVYDLTGAIVYSGICDGSMTVSLQQGSYIVRAGGKAQKITVR